jgi:hypothetical protein
MTQSTPPETAQTTPEQRVAAALRAWWLSPAADACAGGEDPDYHEAAAAIIAADPTLICPDPKAHALADAVRRHTPVILAALKWRADNPRWPDEHPSVLRDAVAAITAALEGDG